MVQRNGLFRDTPQSEQAIADFVALAQAFDMAPATLALAWVNQVDGVTSTIIGATDMAQLKQNIAAFSFELTEAHLAAMADFLRRHPQPF